MSTSDKLSPDETSDISINETFSLQVSGDQLNVFLIRKTPSQNDEPGITTDMVLDKLKSAGITYGIDEEKITQLLSIPVYTDAVDNCIAKGICPVNGINAELNWSISENYLQNDCAIVLPDELIALYKEATNATTGKTVYGKDIKALNGSANRIQIGEGIKTHKTDSGDEYYASRLGRVIFTNDKSQVIQVASLLEISSNYMEAYMDIYALSANNQAITPEHIINELTANEISSGINEEIIKASLHKAALLSSNKPLSCLEHTLIAQGTEPVPGKDGSLILSHKQNIVGEELSYGYIDFHELGYPWNVNKDDRIGYLIEAKPGTDGLTIRGDTIKAAKVKNIKCKFVGIHKDDKGRLYADFDGALLINGTSLSVVDLLVVSTDVGPKTGNIHSKIAVHVKGHVQPGYILESEKDVIIDNNVEDATVRSGSDILIKGGIRGIQSSIYSPSDVHVSFVENASIFLNGKLHVNGSITNSIVASNDSVFVGNQKSKHSIVVGGELTVHKHLEVYELGSDSYSKTIVRIGIAQEERRALLLIDKELDEINNKLEKINQMEYHHKNMPMPDSKEVMYKLSLARKALLDNNASLVERKDSILTELKRLDNSKLIIKKCVYPGVTVFIKDCFYKVKTKLGSGSFVYDRENNQVKFLAE